MGYRTLRQCIDDLSANGHLIEVEDEVDVKLEAAEIHRRVYQSGGPAILFKNVVGCEFPMVSNLFGTIDRARFLFRDRLDAVHRLIELKIDPNQFWKQPTRYLTTPWTALGMLPKKVGRGPILQNQTQIMSLPQLTSWPDDGGAFITLPIVYTEDVTQPGMLRSNLGMYRIQMSGGSYQPNDQIGLHYQLHRGIGVHHTAAVAAGEPFHVNIFVGGTPAMTLAAVMPLPEGMSELTFAGALAGHRIPMVHGATNRPLYAEADFCICGTVIPDRLLPEGPFGDHLGYYSLAHDFPVLQVDRVYHRTGAIWPFTVVGRPPQEDTVFGKLIHELTGPIIPTVLPGVQQVHAVDAAGVHPLLLAIGTERYTPYSDDPRPQEILTQAHAILGQGQMSLAKYLFITAAGNAPDLNANDIEDFFVHVLRRVDWRRDLHFITNTTIDTLDYSGSGLNRGSKVIIAAAGPAIRELPTEIPTDLQIPKSFGNPRVCLPGILAVEGPEHTGTDDYACRTLCEGFNEMARAFPLIVMVDDSDFISRTLSNFLWVTFTRSNPAADIDGVGALFDHKHWGCEGPLVIDARSKPHHAPPLIEDPQVTKKVDALATRGGPLAEYL